MQCLNLQNYFKYFFQGSNKDVERCYSFFFNYLGHQSLGRELLEGYSCSADTVIIQKPKCDLL